MQNTCSFHPIFRGFGVYTECAIIYAMYEYNPFPETFTSKTRTAVARVDSKGNIMTTASDFLFEVARGTAPGFSLVNKFGQNSDLNSSTFEDVWDVGGVYTYPADGTAPISHIDSTDAGDTEPMQIQGLDIDGVLTVQTKTLTGTTLVELDTPLWRVFRMINTGSTDLVGDVQAVDATDTTTYAQVQAGNNQTLMALYTIPAGKTGYLVQGSTMLSGVTRSVAASGRFLARPYGGVFQLKHTFGVGSDGGQVVVPFPAPMVMPALTDLRVEALGSANGVEINATFSIVLEDD